MIYPGCLGDHYTGLGAQTLVSKKHFQSFLFSVVFHQKIYWCSDQWFHKVSNYFAMAWKKKIQTEEKNNKKKRCQSKRSNCLQKCFHSFKDIIDHINVHIFLLEFFMNLLPFIVQFLMYYYCIRSYCFTTLTSL